MKLVSSGSLPRIAQSHQIHGDFAFNPVPYENSAKNSCLWVRHSIAIVSRNFGLAKHRRRIRQTFIGKFRFPLLARFFSKLFLLGLVKGLPDGVKLSGSMEFFNIPCPDNGSD